MTTNTPAQALLDLRKQDHCGPEKFSGREDALYERHLAFDPVIPASEASPRDKYEAAARAVRDVLSQRWIKTDKTYQTRNVKRVYYLSMEFLLGRMLANNVTNLRLEPVVAAFQQLHDLDPLELSEPEPDPGLGNGGLGRLAACFLDSMATLGLPGMGYGLRYEYGIFRQSNSKRLANRATRSLARATESLGSRAAQRSG